MIDLSVLIVSHETAPLLIECLDSLAEARRAHPELAFEVLVIDNGSRDSSVARAAAHPIAPRVIAGLQNRGFAAAVNRGLRLRRGRHVLLLNSDVRVQPDLLARAVAILDVRGDVGVLGPALAHEDGRPQRSVHSIPSLGRELIPEWMRPGTGRRNAWASIGLDASFPAPEGEALREVEALRGAVFFIRGDVVEKLGMLDEGYFFFLEETEYCARVREAGYRVGYCAFLQATHQLGASSKRKAPLATRIEYHRSLYRFLRRREGARVANTVRSARILRNGATVVVLGLPALLLPKLRARWAERWGLLLWHLRGCPAEPSLAEALSQRTG